MMNITVPARIVGEGPGEERQREGLHQHQHAGRDQHGRDDLPGAATQAGEAGRASASDRSAIFLARQVNCPCHYLVNIRVSR